MQDLIILGTGGNCLDIVDAAEAINQAAASPRYRVLGFLDDNPAVQGTEICGLPVLGPLKSAAAVAINSLSPGGFPFCNRGGRLLPKSASSVNDTGVG